MTEAEHKQAERVREPWMIYVCPEHLWLVHRHDPDPNDPPHCLDHQGIPKRTVPFVALAPVVEALTEGYLCEDANLKHNGTTHPDRAFGRRMAYGKLLHLLGIDPESLSRTSE